VEGRVFDERSVDFELGEGLDQAIPRGVELALEKLKVIVVLFFSLLGPDHSSWC
jgi:hypothetical protein